MLRAALALGVAILATGVSAQSWELRLDKGTLGQKEIAAILAGNEYAETSSHTQQIEDIDFSAYAQSGIPGK